MKHVLCLFLALLMCLPAAAGAEEETQDAAVFAMQRVSGPGGSYVEYPLFTLGGAAAEKMNATIAETARIEQYLTLLSTLSENGTGLKMDCDITAGKRYVSILLTAEGKMLSGPPSKVYYPFVFDMENGESVPFEALFADAGLAKETIGDLIGSEIAPQLSTYLENSEMEPVPFERYCLNHGVLTIYYEKRQLSFLSGDPGAISFRFSELWDALDMQEGTPIRDLMPQNAYEAFWDENASRREWQRNCSEKGMLCGLPGVAVGDDLPAVLDACRCTVDDGFYPGGACYEVEAARLRGTWLLTDDDAQIIRGILTSRLDSMGIETGKTTLDHALSLLGEPDAQMQIDADTAERYLVCPGVAAQYGETVKIGEETLPASCILYADADGIVRYILLSTL